MFISACLESKSYPKASESGLSNNDSVLTTLNDVELEKIETETSYLKFLVQMDTILWNDFLFPVLKPIRSIILFSIVLWMIINIQSN